MRRLVAALRLPIALLAAALLPGACGSDPPPDRGPTVLYRYDGTPDGLQQVKRLAGFYCEDRYGATASLIRTSPQPTGYAEAMYECM